MLTIRRILFPTDYSACAEGAFTHAAYLADRHGAELHLLHVTEPVGDPLETCFDDFRITPADLAADLHLPLPERDDRPADEPVRIVSAEESGPDPAPVILRYARDHDIDLIVMGTHGRRGLRRMMVGSVAEEVVRLAPCPVFTVRTHDETDDMAPWVIRRVLVPVDLSTRSTLTARHAAALASVYGAELDLVTVLDTGDLATLPFDPMGGKVSLDEARRRAQKTLDALMRALEAEVPTLRDHVTTHLEAGHPVNEILDLAETTGADLIVLGSHGHTGLERLLLGSVASQLVRSAPCPVFVCKSFGKSLVDAGVPAERDAQPAAV
ncbi:MAG: universal stress protein [Rhodothermales bacterium]